MALLGLLLPMTLHPVLADDGITEPSTSGATPVSYVSNQKYTVTIPLSVDLSDGGTGSGIVTIKTGEDLKIPPGNVLSVALTAGRSQKLTTADDIEGISYTVNKNDSEGDEVAPDGIRFIRVSAGATGDPVSQVLHFAASGTPKFSGTYTGTADFTITVAPEAGEEITFAGATWRILNPDIDATVPGHQALIIKQEALSEKEMSDDGATGTDTPGAASLFSDSQANYFDSNGDNGYDHSLLKHEIGNYYAHFIANTPEAQYVNGVELNNPTFEAFKNKVVAEGEAPFISAEATASSWGCTSWYKDERFATTLGSTKEAFALSYGDIHSYLDSETFTGDLSAPLLDFRTFLPPRYWLRSPGTNTAQAGLIYNANMKNSVNTTTVDASKLKSVRPALVVTLH
ncbi:MAG: hypothetical protein LBS41_01575 [Streptococcaceae bacterium]|nr:hypothetical protein [Streptococcaceae bacterium]